MLTDNLQLPNKKASEIFQTAFFIFIKNANLHLTQKIICL